jgi:hypothetical protein
MLDKEGIMRRFLITFRRRTELLRHRSSELETYNEENRRQILIIVQNMTITLHPEVCCNPVVQWIGI